MQRFELLLDRLQRQRQAFDLGRDLFGADGVVRDFERRVRDELRPPDRDAARDADAVQDEAWKLFGAIWSPTAIVVDNRPRNAEGNLIHDALNFDPPTSGKVA